MLSSHPKGAKVDFYQEFINHQRQRSVSFLTTALKMVDYGCCLGDQFTDWEQKIIDELIQFTRIPNPPTRNQLVEELKFQLECMSRRGENNPKVTWGENRLFKMVNEIRSIGDVF
jgi:hypothetical protein